MTIHDLILSRLPEPFTGQAGDAYLAALAQIEIEQGEGKWVCTGSLDSIAVCDDPEVCARVACGIAPATVPVVVSITPRQMRLALIDIGVMPNQITSALAAIPDAQARAKALAEWEFAGAILRTHPLIPGLCAAFGMSEAQVDALFAAAAML